MGLVAGRARGVHRPGSATAAVLDNPRRPWWPAQCRRTPAQGRKAVSGAGIRHSGERAYGSYSGELAAESGAGRADKRLFDFVVGGDAESHGTTRSGEKCAPGPGFKNVLCDKR